MTALTINGRQSLFRAMLLGLQKPSLATAIDQRLTVEVEGSEQTLLLSWRGPANGLASIRLREFSTD